MILPSEVSTTAELLLYALLVVIGNSEECGLFNHIAGKVELPVANAVLLPSLWSKLNHWETDPDFFCTIQSRCPVFWLGGTSVSSAGSLVRSPSVGGSIYAFVDVKKLLCASPK